jgi:hypothetical protein
MAQVGRQLTADMVQCMTEYKTAIQSLQLQGSLRSQQLIDPAARAETRRKCALATEALANVQKEMRNLMTGLPARLLKAGVSEKASRSFAAGFNSNFNERALDHLVSLEHQLFDETTGILDLMDDVGNRATIRDGKLIFASQIDLSAYQAHVRRIVDLSNEEVELQKQALQRTASIAGE